MAWRTTALGLGTVGIWLVFGGCLGAPVERGPRSELEGEVGAGGFGGVLVGVGGTPVQTSSSTTTTTTTTSGGGGGNVCDQAYEDNDTEDTAFDLGDINDCDGDGGDVTASLEPGDADWYRYDGSDDFGCVATPERTLMSNDNLRLCKFIECKEGQVDVTCKDGSTPATSPGGRQGCCHSTGFTVDIECPGIDDDITAYIRLDQPASACVEYILDYHF